jgi:hypothetical protein
VTRFHKPELDNQAEAAQSQLAYLEDSLSVQEKRLVYYSAAAVALLVVLPALILWATDRRDHYVIVVLITSVLLGMVMGAGALVKYIRIRQLEEDISSRRLEAELQGASGLTSERRAEKLLHINQAQLRRYYDQNLNQSFWVFLVGVLALGSGIGIIGLSLYLVIQMPPTELSSQIVVAAIGALGSILTNYVAAIYLKMHASTTATLTSFHARLVATHELFFANLLASRVLPDDKQADVIARMAFAITKVTADATQDLNRRDPAKQE